jgi:hypothetical protein
LIPPPVGDVTELMFIFYVLASSSVTDILWIWLVLTSKFWYCAGLGSGMLTSTFLVLEDLLRVVVP